MKSPFFLFLLVICYSNFSFSQSTFQIQGVLEDQAKEALPFANVLLVHAKDSTLVKGTVTNDNGIYILPNIQSGNYLILASMVGYTSVYSDPFQLNADVKIPALVLKSGESLDEVVVTADKPLFTQKIDRMVINVENSIVSAGGSALEILERSPGVLINKQNGSISIIGKEGVEVMINGKTSYVPASGLVQLLEGMSADNISSIELITSPPSNLDAEGNAGFINIVLKKRTDLGLNGSYALSGGYGKGWTSSDNLNFNYRKGQLNLFGSYSFSVVDNEQTLRSEREYTNGNALISNLTTSDRFPIQRNHNLRLGLDYQVSENTLMALLVNGYDNKWTMDAFNESTDYSNGLITDFFELSNEEINHWKHFGANYNITHHFKENNYLSFDLDYLFYTDNNPTDYVNTRYDETRTFISEELLRSRKKTPINTYVSKLDYVANLNPSIKLETGVKGTFSTFDNTVSVENLVNNNWQIDPTLTNKSELNEKILGLYTSLEYALSEKVNIKAGLRYEYTDSQLEVDTQGKVVDRQYGILFPSAFINRKFNDDFSMNLSYTKRITRPNFNDLAPFVILLGPNTFASGNSALQPAISNAIKYDLNYRSAVLSFQFTHQDSPIALFQETIDEATGRLFIEASNLDYTKSFTINIGFPLKINSWWRMQNNLNYLYQENRAFYQGDPIGLNLHAYSANSTQSFKFSDSFSGEIMATYSSPTLFGSAIFNDIYQINAGIQKNLGDKWGTLKFSVNDIFDSFEYDISTNLKDQNINTSSVWDLGNRTYVLTYSRNFGNRKLKSARDRKTGAEEERKRVQ